MNRWGPSLLLLVASLGSGLASGQDYYEDDDRYSRRQSEFVNARVLDIRAVYDDAEEYCWDVPVTPAPRPAAAAGKQEFVGGVVGGVVAKPSTKGTPSFTPTPAGNALEAAVARVNQSRVQQRQYGGEVRYERRCEVAQGAQRDRLVGYEVTVDYDGYTAQVFSERRPGRRIRVRLEDLEY